MSDLRDSGIPNAMYKGELVHRCYGHCVGGKCVDCLAADRDRYKQALERAHEQLSKHDYKGPKQISRALTTMREALDA